MARRLDRWARRLVIYMFVSLLTAVAGAAGAVVPALAAGLDVGGATGLLTIPTADVVGSGRLAVGYHVQAPLGSRAYNNIAVTAGLTNDLELGVASGFYFGVEPATSFNAKYRIIPESAHVPALAVGVDNLVTGGRTQFYLVLSKAIPELTTRFHAGVGNWGLFLGASKAINPVSLRGGRGSAFPETTFIAEWNGGWDGGLFNLGLRMQPIPHLLVDVGILNLQTPILGLQYAIQF